MLETIEDPDLSLEDRYALPGGEKDKVAFYEPAQGTTVRISNAGPNKYGEGGGIQYEIREPDVRDSFEDLTTGDFPGSFSISIDRENLQQALTEKLNE